MDIITLASEFAINAHGNQKRSDGRLYYEHPARVAKLVQQYKSSDHIDELIAAAYLHDTLEDTEITYYDLVSTFDYCIASLVLEVTSNPDIKNAVGSKKEYLAHKLKHMTHWALVIKLCDRLDNVSDMNGCSKSWIKKYIEETQFIIDYLEKNRELTGTHKRIIKNIKEVIIEKTI